jgi:hypothetical protein
MADTLLRGSTVDAASQRFAGSAQSGALASIGYVVAENVVFIPTGSFETGYVSNPDALFIRTSASPFGTTEVSGTVGFLNSAGATTFAVKSRLTVFGSDVERPERWDAGAAVDNAYRIAPGLTATFGAYALKDWVNLVPDDAAGGYAQLAYQDSFIEFASRLKADQINYLGKAYFTEGAIPELLPFLKPSAFDVRRTESVTSVLVAPKAVAGLYGEVGAALVDYLSQPDVRVVNRDATEGWIKGGVRVNIGQTLRVEAGWRFNDRETEDRRVSSYSSSFFDGKVIWAALPTTTVVFDIDRKLVEPGTAFAIVGDQTVYLLSVTHKASEDWTVQGFGRYRILDQIGDVQRYTEGAAGVGVAYQWLPKTALTGSLSYARGEETSSGQTYDVVRVSAGSKIQF